MDEGPHSRLMEVRLILWYCYDIRSYIHLKHVLKSKFLIFDWNNFESLIQCLQEWRKFWVGVSFLTRPIFLSNPGRCWSTRWVCVWSCPARWPAGSSCLPTTSTAIHWSLEGWLLLIWCCRHIRTNVWVLDILHFKSCIIYANPFRNIWSLHFVSTRIIN